MAGRQKKPDEGQQRGKLGDEVAALDGQTQQRNQAEPAEVGIIFFHGNRLWIDSTLVNDAVDYGELKTHEKGHPDYWEELQRRGLVPREFEYDEVPRGRVTYAPKLGRALLFLDGCILIRPDLVIQIRKAMHLPPGAATEVRGDSHYVCPSCRRIPEDEEDW
jgi:hypothetical protein